MLRVTRLWYFGDWFVQIIGQGNAESGAHYQEICDHQPARRVSAATNGQGQGKQTTRVAVYFTYDLDCVKF